MSDELTLRPGEHPSTLRIRERLSLLCARPIESFADLTPMEIEATLRVWRAEPPAVVFDPCPECSGDVDGCVPVIVEGPTHHLEAHIVVHEPDVVTAHRLVPCGHEVDGVWWVAPEYVMHYGQPPGDGRDDFGSPADDNQGATT